MTSAGSLVPITREVLRQFYAQFPMDPVPPHAALTDSIQGQIQRLSAISPPLTKKVQERFALETPTRLDDNFWRTRMLSEEIAHNLEGLCKKRPELAKQLSPYKETLLQAEKEVGQTQRSNTEAAASQVKKFLPQDFRASFVEKRRAAKEATNTKAVEDLVKRGGSIRERYDLLMEQQWERRQALVQLGNLSGIYKFLVKYLGGVPQVLLDFAKEINAKIGPMEEQRIKYGPDLYAVTTLGVHLNILTALWLENAEAIKDNSDEIWGAVHPAIDFYCHHLVRVVQFLGSIFVKSPFFVTRDDVERAVAATSENVSQRSGSAVSVSMQGADILLEQCVAPPFTPDPNAGMPADTVLGKLSPAWESRQGGETSGFIGAVPDGSLRGQQGAGGAGNNAEGMRRWSTGGKTVAKSPHGLSEVAVVACAAGSAHSHERAADMPGQVWQQPLQQHLHQHPHHHHSELGNLDGASVGPSTIAGSEHFMSCADNASMIDEDVSPGGAVTDLHGFRHVQDTPRASPALPALTSPSATAPLPLQPMSLNSQQAHLDVVSGAADSLCASAASAHLHAASTSVSLLVHNPSRGGGSSISSSSSSRPPASSAPTQCEGGAGSMTTSAAAVAAAAAAGAGEHFSSTSPHAPAAAVSQSSITMTSMSSLSQPPGGPPLHCPQSLSTHVEGDANVRDTSSALIVGSSFNGSHANRSYQAGAAAAAGGDLSSVTGLTTTDGGEDGSSLGSMSQPGAAGVASDIATVGSPKPYESSVGLASVLEEDDRSVRHLASSRNSLLGFTQSEMHTQDGLHLPPSRLSTQPRMSVSQRQPQHQPQQQLRQRARTKEQQGDAQKGCCIVQ